MPEKHVIRFEPVGIEIEVAEDQNILRAAAEQGIMLMHGCKEGQCASCKSFILEGDDIEHDKYSTFALPDYELEEGYTLLCRAHAYEDMTIELLNYDEEMIRSGLPIQQGVTEVVSKDAVTHDMRHLVLRLIEPAEIKFFPGQYVDIAIPGTGAVRSFSMANTSSRESGLLEFVIKVYPDGQFSRFLAETLAEGDRLDITGPFGVFTLREGDNDLVFVGGGAGMAPILSLLRTMAERGLQRKATFFYGARTSKDLCFEAELRSLEEKLPDFRYIPALSEPAGSGPAGSGPAGSEPGDEEEWDGETGLITDVVKRHASDLRGAHAYVCGPPPMVEAALPLLATLGVEEKRIYYDKFTTTGNPQE
jgi:propane monooxygenase reductase component